MLVGPVTVQDGTELLLTQCLKLGSKVHIMHYVFLVQVQICRVTCRDESDAVSDV